jgi:hypothetical protein
MRFNNRCKNEIVGGQIWTIFGNVEVCFMHLVRWCINSVKVDSFKCWGLWIGAKLPLKICLLYMEPTHCCTSHNVLSCSSKYKFSKKMLTLWKCRVPSSRLMILTKRNMMFSVWLYLMLIPSYHVQRQFSILLTISVRHKCAAAFPTATSLPV